MKLNKDKYPWPPPPKEESEVDTLKCLNGCEPDYFIREKTKRVNTQGIAIEGDVGAYRFRCPICKGLAFLVHIGNANKDDSGMLPTLQLGKIEISRAIFKREWETVRGLLSQFVVLNVDYSLPFEGIIYTLWGSAFKELPPNAVIPFYEVYITKTPDGKSKYEIKGGQ